MSPEQQAQMLDSAMLAFYSQNGTIAGAGRTHRSTITNGAIEVTPYTFEATERTAHPPISLATAAISVGKSPIASGPGSQSIVNGAVLITRGGTIESLRNRADGLHQEWTFTDSPGTGDVDVDVSVSGYAYAGTTDGGVHFSGDGVMVRYSHAVWTSADGNSWPVTAAYDEATGHIHLIVPATVVAVSTYPAQLDPTISAEVAVDSPVIAPTGAPQQQSAIVFGGTEYLAVWSDSRDSAQPDIWGTRLASDGTVLDTLGIQIAASTGAQSNPAVTYDGTAFVVAWEDFLVNNGPTSNIKVARVSTTGAVTAVGAVTVTAGSQTTPNLASAGSGTALLVWNTVGEVDGAIVSGSVGATTSLATGALVERPSVASNPAGDYFVGYTASNHLLGQLVTAAGTLDGAAITVSAPVSGTQSQSDAAFDGTNYDVAWKNGTNALVYGTRITTAGAVLDTHMVGAATVGGVALNAAPAQSFRPTISCQSSGCLISWHDLRNSSTTSYDIYGQLITLAFARSGTEIVFSTAVGPQQFPRLASNGAGWFVEWTDNRSDTSSQIYGAAVTTVGAIGAASAIGSGDNRESAITIGRSGTDSALFWRDSRGGPSIYYVRYDASGAALDTTGMPVQAGSGGQNAPDASADMGGNTLVVWEDTRGGTNKDIYGARVTLASGTVLDASGIAISSAANDQLVPSVATNGTVALVVWQDNRNSNFDIYGALIDSSGAIVANDIAISSTTGAQVDPAVTWDPTSSQFIVMWQDGRAAMPQIFGTRVDTTGAVLDPSGVAIVASAAAQTVPALASTPGGSLAVWIDGSHIRGARLAGGASLSVVDPAGIAISSTTSNQSAPKVGVLGASYAVVWADDRAGNEDIYGQMVTGAGALAASNFVISASSYDEINPSVTATTATTARVSYEAHTLDTSRAESRTLTNAVESITVTPAGSSVNAGLNLQFTATATFSDGTTGDITPSVVWSSSDTTIATISSPGGLAHGVAASMTPVTITATLGAVQGSTTLTVNGPILVSIAVTPTPVTVAVGFQQQFVATGTYSDGTTAHITPTVAWTSSSTTVATISPSGLATVRAAGLTTITATQGLISGTASLTGKVLTLTSIAITPNPVSLNPGASKVLVATGTFNDMSTLVITTQVAWTSSNTAVATVGASGLVKAVALGSTTITATKNGVMGTDAVSVVPPTLVSIKVTPANQLITKGSTETYTATGTFSDGSTQNITGTVVWTSSKTAVATMAANVATGTSAGTTTITATSGAITGTTPLNVSNTPLASIAVTRTSGNLPIGYAEQFLATGTFMDGSMSNVTSQVAWASSNTSIATVSTTMGTLGFVTGVALGGPATISATLNGVMGSATVTVTNATLTSIAVTPATNTIIVGHSKDLIATGTFSDATVLPITTQVTWTSSNTAVATVGASALVTAIASGNATITASKIAVNGTATVTVP